MTTAELNTAVAKELGTDPFDMEFHENRNHTQRIITFMSKTVQTRVAYLNALRDVISQRMPKNKAGTPMVTDFDGMEASPEEMCLAFLKARGVKI